MGVGASLRLPVVLTWKSIFEQGTVGTLRSPTQSLSSKLLSLAKRLYLTFLFLVSVKYSLKSLFAKKWDFQGSWQHLCQTVAATFITEEKVCPNP